MTPLDRPAGDESRSDSPLELWGGIECTVNRVGDNYFDQIAQSGHDDRLTGDLERFAALGLRTIRYPVIWERVAPGAHRYPDWRRTDSAQLKLRELEIDVIAGLVHHGSGPRYTSLIDATFPERLRDYARMVAQRYPWLEMWTPVNEPLTTARFSGLYGIWYPHARNDYAFVRAFINECLAIRLAMDAVRRVNPDSRLVQTEDLGRVYSTPSLRYQADFENHRRWLTFDLLNGRIDRHHPMWDYLVANGASRAELASFVSNPCPPDIIGINHYLTSERFLDERTELYPEHLRGGNGRHEYADVEAVRALEDGIAGHLGVLREAWNRYRLPIAVTEVHLGCTADEQLRWLNEAWQAALQARGEGATVVAVTVWALLGSFGWDSLLTVAGGRYEPGAFDISAGEPQLTVVGEMVRALARTGHFEHPSLDSVPWWRKPSRICHPAYRHGQRIAPAAKDAAGNSTVAGATGVTGAFADGV
ncbi:MAG TPA: family 1 glycosylhydrolase [Gemmatimonadaceae bacterium]|nr:family 1 glycosylhydrolase [Gemmatimonadaceae bacterium]